MIVEVLIERMFVEHPSNVSRPGSDVEPLEETQELRCDVPLAYDRAAVIIPTESVTANLQDGTNKLLDI